MVLCRRVISLFFLLCVTACYAELPHDAVRQFEKIVNGTPGVLTTFPEDLRNCRSGPVTQKVTVSDDGYLTIQITFLCAHHLEKHKAVSVKRFYLKDLAGNRRVEANRHLNTMTFFDHAAGWTISFRSLADLDKAVKLFSILLSHAPQRQEERILPSHMAREAGYKYVVAAPRSPGIEEGMSLLSFPEQSPRLLMWLTKKEIQDKALFEEAMNASPLYVYDLSILDQAPFYTVFNPAVTTFFPCSIEGECLQSVFFDDTLGLQHYFDSSTIIGLRFQKMPYLLSPVAVIVTAQQKHVIQKRMNAAEWVEENPLFYNEEIPQGTTISWFSGINETSDDICRYLFSLKHFDRFALKNVLYREYPNLEKLLTAKGRLRKDLPLDEFICMEESALDSSNVDLSPSDRNVLRVAFFTHECGALFGPDDQIAYNSWPMALCLAEKLGFQEKEKKILRALVETPTIVVPKDLDDELLPQFFQAARIAQDIGIPIGEWLQVQRCYLRILLSQIPPNSNLKGYEALLGKVQKRYALLMPFGLACGIKAEVGQLPALMLFSTYIWEERDSLHRDGLSMNRRREKYEHMIVDNPHSPWKGRFWEWLDNDMRKKPVAPNKYLTPDERKMYKAIFEEGKLVSPIIPEGNVEAMFVVDRRGQLYIGMKKEGSSPEDPGLNHASFLGAQPVASAGKITFQDRSPIHLTDHSGHYRPGPKEMAIALSALAHHGVKLEDVQVDIGAGNHRKKQTLSAKEFLRELPHS